MEHTCLIMLSGGIDSTVLAYSLVKQQEERPYAVAFKYGQRHGIEVHCAKMQAADLDIPIKIIDLTSVFETFKSALCGTYNRVPTTEEVLGDAQPIIYVPWRNAIFLSVCLGLAESLNIPKIYYGAQQNDNYEFFDTTPQFIAYMNLLTSLNRKHQCTIEATFKETQKKDIVQLGMDLGVDFERVISCYNPTTTCLHVRACGVCPSCTQRLKAFRTLRIKDPFKYKRKLDKYVET